MLPQVNTNSFETNGKIENNSKEIEVIKEKRKSQT